MIDLPKMPFRFGAEPTNYVGEHGGFEMAGENTEAVYRGVQQAKANDSIVLQVVGDSTPVRVLPLPPDGTPVYVSELITQTGVLRKLGTVQATLFRYSPSVIGGAPMDVRMNQTQDGVRPECDYALRAGDRLRVRKTITAPLLDLLQQSVGL